MNGMETVLLFAQMIATGALAGWLTLGVRDNILHPSINETYTAEVMDMTRMRSEYPEVYEQVSHRAVSDRKLQQFAFRAVIAMELCASILLWIGVLFLFLSIFGAVRPDTARVVAILGATAFLAVWTGMLIVGNYFCYWLCHDGAQNTHYQMALWGIGTLIFLAQSA